MDTILVIEDDEGLNRGICFWLKKEGYEVLSAANLTQGRQLLRAKPVDLLLLDITLPDGDGFAFCNEIRESLELPIIILTAKDAFCDNAACIYPDRNPCAGDRLSKSEKAEHYYQTTGSRIGL